MIYCIQRNRDSTTKASVSQYRELQIGSLLFNEVFQNYILPVMMTGLVIIGTLAIYSSIAYSSNLPTPILLYMVVVTAACTHIEVGIYGAAGGIHESSQRWITSLKSRLGAKDKLQRRIVSSLQDLKCRFGYSNFVERSTCLVFLDFTAVQVVNLLLAGRKSG